MNITLKLRDGETRKLTLAFKGVDHADAEGDCPLCGAKAFGVAGANMRVDSHDTYASDAFSTCCKRPAGTIYARVSTVFGIEEDERMLKYGRARVY